MGRPLTHFSRSSSAPAAAGIVAVCDVGGSGRVTACGWATSERRIKKNIIKNVFRIACSPCLDNAQLRAKLARTESLQTVQDLQYPLKFVDAATPRSVYLMRCRASSVTS